VGTRICLDDMEKRKFLPLPRLELRPLGHPARSQSLYRLYYPGSHYWPYYLLFKVYLMRKSVIRTTNIEWQSVHDELERSGRDKFETILAYS
jgi:hypothetical protein